MVIFDQLRIDKEGKSLYIDAHLRKDLQGKNSKGQYHRISKVYICDSKDYSEDYQLTSELVYTLEMTGLTESEYAQRCNEIHLKIDASGYFDSNNIPRTYDKLPSTFLNKMLFVFVEVEGVDQSNINCGCAKNPAVGVALSMNSIYNEFMSLIRDLNNQCSKPTRLADFILRLNALILSIDATQYRQGIMFFDKWFGDNNHSFNNSNCGCNG